MAAPRAMIEIDDDSAMTDARYAIYYAPEADEPLWTFGSAVLGYDAATGTAVAPYVPAGMAPARWAELTTEPRRYGFHATVKAPFRLAAGQTEAALRGALAAFAEGVPSFEVDLEVRGLGGFVALVPTGPAPAILTLERSAVIAFEPFRAALTRQEVARRLASGLTPRQTELLERYGYPYVHDEFRFHMTLTGRLPEALREGVAASLAGAYGAAVPSRRIHVRSLCLFRQESAAASFRIIARSPLAVASPPVLDR